MVPLFVAAALLLCADPAPVPSAETATLEEIATLSVAPQTEYAVIASSPVPAGAGIGSHFGYRTSTRTHERTFHAGLDFLVPRNTPVYAVYDGVVEQIAHEGPTHQFAG